MDRTALRARLTWGVDASRKREARHTPSHLSLCPQRIPPPYQTPPPPPRPTRPRWAYGTRSTAWWCAATRSTSPSSSPEPSPASGYAPPPLLPPFFFPLRSVRPASSPFDPISCCCALLVSSQAVDYGVHKVWEMNNIGVIFFSPSLSMNAFLFLGLFVAWFGSWGSRSCIRDLGRAISTLSLKFCSPSWWEWSVAEVRIIFWWCLFVCKMRRKSHAQRLLGCI